MRWLAVVMLFGVPVAATATPSPASSPLLPPILPGMAVALTPYATIPPEPGVTAAPLARIQYATPVPDGSGRLFVNDLNGAIYQTKTGASPALWLDVGAVLGTAAVNNGDPGHGLQSLAFHPNYAGDPAKPGYGTFYTSTNGTAGGATIGANDPGKRQVAITEWVTDPKAPGYTAAASPRTVMQIGGYTDGHSNGLIAFNPTAKPGSADYGQLYIGSGDGHFNDADQNAQSLSVPQGKMLRINPLQSGALPYTVPADNPFRGMKGALPELWATGLRLPQSFSWDLATGAMYINDLGQAAIEEVDLGIAGANYGWSQREGTYATGYAYGGDSNDQNVYPLPPGGNANGYTDPIAEFEHADGASVAVGSGFVYRGTRIAALQGMYVLEDIVSGDAYYFDPAAVPPGGQAPLHALSFTLGGAPVKLDERFGYDNDYSHRVDTRLSQGLDGELVIALKSNGMLFQLDAVPVPEPGSLALLGTIAGLGVLVRRQLRA